jgi:very-short-patch-repair endonuclease
MAAILTCGPTAVLSHLSAAFVWRLLISSPGAVIDVSTRQVHREPRAGVRVHRRGAASPDEITVCDALPITTPARTLLDLAGCLSVRDLEHALARADRLGLASAQDVSGLLDRYPRLAGRRKLRTLLAATAGPALTRSEAESRFLALIRRAGVRAPETNVVVHGYEVDFLWRAERLVVEVDGFAFHGSATSFERDRRRDGVLAAAGIRVVRITWRQLVDEPEALVVRLALALASAAREGSPPAP